MLAHISPPVEGREDREAQRGSNSTRQEGRGRATHARERRRGRAEAREHAVGIPGCPRQKISPYPEISFPAIFPLLPPIWYAALRTLGTLPREGGRIQAHSAVTRARGRGEGGGQRTRGRGVEVAQSRGNTQGTPLDALR